MKLTLTIQCDNAAFELWPIGEVSRMLTEYARRIREHGELPDADGDTLRDSNGNTVGRVQVED